MPSTKPRRIFLAVSNAGRADARPAFALGFRLITAMPLACGIHLPYSIG
jgi:hypothetical protein